MATWTFHLTSQQSGAFEVKEERGSGRIVCQAPTTTFPKITGGFATEPSPGTVRVLVSFDDGRTGEFIRSATGGGRIDFIKYL